MNHKTETTDNQNLTIVKNNQDAIRTIIKDSFISL